LEGETEDERLFRYLSFHVAINYPNAPDWVVGSSMDDELLMVSPMEFGQIMGYQKKPMKNNGFNI
jgi:hypothetical protein